MHSPLIALAWEICRRGRRSTWLVLGCIVICAFANLLFLGRMTPDSQRQFTPFFGLFMTLSFLFLIGIFNYTEYSSTKEWHGFPYRLFTLPLPTWQLVTLPMVIAVVSVELVYLAWIKLVWTHGQIPIPEWFAVVLGTYIVIYQTMLWVLAGFRILRVITLSLGGVTSVGVACLPFLGKAITSPWLSEKCLIAMLIGLAFTAFLIAWAAVARHRCGGGRQERRLRLFWIRVMDALPRRRRDFASPAAAQFWYEWRRAGWLLPACTAFVIVVVVAPISWFYRHDSHSANFILSRLFGIPLVLAFVIGKGFIKCEFWSTNLALPQFLAVRPLNDDEFVMAKMKVAAVSAVISGLLILGFLGLWLSTWANTAHLKPILGQLRMFYAHSWHVILILYFGAFLVLIWRCLVSGLWVGLSGKPSHYFGAAGLQVGGAALLLLAVGIWADDIDATLRTHPNVMKSVVSYTLGWILAFLIIVKLWYAAFAWNKSAPRRTWQYLAIWLSATVCFVTLAVLSRPPFDSNRLAHLFLLAALLIFPLAHLGLAPLALAKNRHR